jgi:hypothetical protein
MRCSTCDYALPEDVTFCPNCGARVPAASAGLPTVSLPSPDLLPTTPAPPVYAPQQPAYGQQPTGLPQGALSGPPPVVVELPRSTAAIVSLVAGILTWCGLFGIGAIVAVIAGHMALGEIKRAQGMMEGRGMAIAGLVLGYVQFAFLLLILCAIIAIGMLTVIGTRAS